MRKLTKPFVVCVCMSLVWASSHFVNGRIYKVSILGTRVGAMFLSSLFFYKWQVQYSSKGLDATVSLEIITPKFSYCTMLSLCWNKHNFLTRDQQIIHFFQPIGSNTTHGKHYKATTTISHCNILSTSQFWDVWEECYFSLYLIHYLYLVADLSSLCHQIYKFHL